MIESERPTEDTEEAPSSVSSRAAHEARTSPRQVLLTEARLRLVVSNAPAILFALDPDGTVALYEGKALSDLGFHPGHHVGHSIFAIAADRPGLLEDARRALGGEAFSSTLVLAMRTFDVYWQPQISPSGAVTSVTGVAVDITERVAESTRLAVDDRGAAQYADIVRRLDALQELVSRLLSSQERTRREIAAQVHGKQLTEREQQILRLVAEGWSNREIGAELALAAGTVKNHVARILAKLDVTDRTQAAVRALDLGLIQPRP